MTDQTLERLEKIEEEHVQDVYLDVDDKSHTIGVTERATRLDHAERKLRLEESQHKLEYEKFEYQKKQNMRDNLTRIGLGILTFLGVAVPSLVKLRKMDKAVDTSLKLEGLGNIISSQTARTFMKEEINPRI